MIGWAIFKDFDFSFAGIRVAALAHEISGRSLKLAGFGLNWRVFKAFSSIE
jgi:hypothetical protein